MKLYNYNIRYQDKNGKLDSISNDYSMPFHQAFDEYNTTVNTLLIQGYTILTARINHIS